ncbi:hypothetical protein C0989_002836 [Termitomyces sp. Mn162]|nr:hypothetical protein C0989_002836 [Termitomyces sp. Mn162]
MSESCNLTNLQSIPLTPTAQEAYKPTVYESALPQNVERPSYRNRMILTDLTVDIPESHRVPKDAPATPPKARWGTLEFRTYIAVACVMIPVMTWIPISLSLDLQDNSDAQYRSFRNNFWLLTTLATAYLSIKYLWKRLGTAPPQDNTYLIRYNLFFSDGYQGAYSRWHIVYNLTMLRLVSFNIDYYWACNTSTSKEHNRNRTMTYAERMFPHPPQMYTFLSYLSYALYPPLYLAGPIMTFNDYLWQHRQSMNISGCAKVLYCIRLIASVLTMELILHFMYVVAIKDTSAWDSATPAQISMIGFWNLIIVWLKVSTRSYG